MALSTVVVNLLLPAGNPRGAGFLAAVRLAALTLPLALLFATVPVRSLLDALEIRGLPAGLSFVVAAALAAVPSARRRLERLRQGRLARGLDRGRGLRARSRTVLELTGAMVGVLLAEVEDRTLALEVRGFRAAGRRTQLDPAPDGSGERVLRWALLAAAVALVAARWTGRL